MICPNCQVEVAISEQLFGALYTCGSCQAVYFINFEGQPEFGEVPTGVLSDIVAEPVSEGAEFAVAPEVKFDSPFDASLEPPVDAINMVDFDNKLDAQFDAFPAQEEVAGVPDNNSPAMNNDFLNSELNPFEQEQQEAPPVQNLNSFSQVAKEISDFGNSEGHLSGLNYELQISGLDTHITIKQFREIIDDPRFGWDAGEILRGLKNGRIRFEKLNPVKAFILAKRLQFLDIEKSWKQNAVT